MASPTHDGFCVGGQVDSKRSASYQLEAINIYQRCLDARIVRRVYTALF